MKQLKETRVAARNSAILRDGGFCMMCLWLAGVNTKYQHVHHVFGRGSMLPSIKELVTSLMCVCNACHPQPLLLPPYDDWHYTVLTVWRNMNCSPVGELHMPADYVIQNPIGLPSFKVSDGIVHNWR